MSQYHPHSESVSHPYQRLVLSYGQNSKVRVDKSVCPGLLLLLLRSNDSWWNLKLVLCDQNAVCVDRLLGRCHLRQLVHRLRAPLWLGLLVHFLTSVLRPNYRLHRHREHFHYILGLSRKGDVVYDIVLCFTMHLSLAIFDYVYCVYRIRHPHRDDSL